MPLTQLLMLFIPLLLVPLCSILNHLGGQSTDIHNPRITCRVFGIGLAFGVVSLLCGLGIENSALFGGICLAGMGLWAPFRWGPMFMVFNRTDFRVYNNQWYLPNYWITKITDSTMGVTQYTRLSQSQCREWGAIFGTWRGGMMYPMFIAMGFYITPWAFLIGTFCVLQGVVYSANKNVINSEYWFGAMIGLALATVLIFHLA